MAAKKTILLVDDDDALREALAEQLMLHEDVEILERDTAQKGLALSRETHFDAAILDVALPDMDGRDLCKIMRREGISCPILMLTGADSDVDQILGLDSGANDYIVKPFRLGLLLARLRAQLRQYEQNEDAVYKIQKYLFLPSQKELKDQQSENIIRLTEKETAILKYLLKAEGKVVSRDDLLGEVWGYNAGVTTHTLETHIYRLRQKIEKDSSQAEILVTDVGGYRLVS